MVLTAEHKIQGYTSNSSLLKYTPKPTRLHPRSLNPPIHTPKPTRIHSPIPKLTHLHS